MTAKFDIGEIVVVKYGLDKTPKTIEQRLYVDGIIWYLCHREWYSEEVIIYPKEGRYTY